MSGLDRLIDLRSRCHGAEVRVLLEDAVGFRRPDAVDTALQAYAGDPARSLLGYEQDAKLIGLIGLRDLPDQRRVITHIAVRPDARLRGVGRAMLALAAHTRQAVTLEAETDVDAVGFYRSCGFDIVSLGERYPGFERFRCTLDVRASQRERMDSPMPSPTISWSADIMPNAERIVESARRLVAGHAVLSHSLHGNISIRLPGGDRFLLTGAGTLETLTTDDLGLLDIQGTILGGNIHPASLEIVQMHAAVYRRRDDVQGIIHTHSPYVTAYAIANEPILPTYEAMVRFDVVEAVPVAAYGPRGSERSVSNIIDVVNDTNKAVLLANHGILVFDSSLEKATHLVVILEEAAQFSLMAKMLGGAKPLPSEAIEQARARRDEFERVGEVHLTPADD